jgi:DNA-binding CsgD family transcriptional regulator
VHKLTYREKTLTGGADLIERIAIALSKRSPRAELAQSLFAEMVKVTGASQLILWRRDTRTPSIFHAELANYDADKALQFDAASYEFFSNWDAGAGNAYLLENNADNVPHSAPWSKFNLLLPLSTNDTNVQGMLSLHSSNAFTQAEDLPASIAKVFANAFLAHKQDPSEPSQQLAGELWFERNLRLILGRVHARIDRDYILQTIVDTLGSILKISSCLVIKLEGMSARITHEFVDPDLSPLGLGGSLVVPQVIAAQMCERTTVLEESGIRKFEQDHQDRADSLFESSIRSIAGTPVMINSTCFGAIVIQSNKVRKWQKHELQLLEATAHSASLALRNAEQYQEAKEHVFNLNLITNLTRQLSTAVEHIGKLPKAEAVEEPMLSNTQAKIPLSARELEVLRLIASGLANREIAQRLFLTESTVELHASRIRKKLKLKSRTALVKFACDNHLV